MSQSSLASKSAGNCVCDEKERGKWKDIGKTPAAHVSANFSVCRICQSTSTSENLISPCNCKGTLAYIHLSCLERWLNQSGRNFCELCNFRYDAIRTQRYSLWEGIRLWILHPRNRRHIQTDSIIGLLLTLVTSGLLFICIYGMDYFTLQAEKMGIDKSWIKFSLVGLLIIIVFGYMVAIHLLLRDHLVPWYHWWMRTVNITLQMTSRRIQPISQDISQ